MVHARKAHPRLHEQDKMADLEKVSSRWSLKLILITRTEMNDERVVQIDGVEYDIQRITKKKNGDLDHRESLRRVQRASR